MRSALPWATVCWSRKNRFSPSSDHPAPTKTFPQKFLWGAATAAHQVEDNNINSDAWLLEHLPHSMYKEPSGDACDHYHLYEQDINLLADLGFNAYRFSIEWARIEPKKGFFSNAELDDYRRVLEACHRRGLTPLVTYSPFTVSRWLALQGDWENAESPDLFARYCEKATAHLGDLIAYSATFNEPDILHLLRWMGSLGGSTGPDIATSLASQNAEVRRQLHAPFFNSFLSADAQKSRENMLAAHRPEGRVGCRRSRDAKAHRKTQRHNAGKDCQEQFAVIDGFLRNCESQTSLEIGTKL